MDNHRLNVEFNYLRQLADWFDPGKASLPRFDSLYCELGSVHSRIIKDKASVIGGAVYSLIDIPVSAKADQADKLL